MKKLIIPAFFLLVAAQIYVPASMIIDREKVVSNGSVYLFETAPIDPRDPFRGQYVQLDFKEDSYIPSDIWPFSQGQEIYVHLQKDEADIAKIVNISEKQPASNDYLKASIYYISNERVYIKYPFERFYMEETKAPQAEETLRETSADDQQKAYAKVHIWQGESVLTDVLVDGQSLREINGE